jgi:hypothetical protein
VGWYAAYAKPDAKKSAGSTNSGQLPGPSLMLPIDVPGGRGR